MEECYIYTYEDSVMEPTKHCLERGGRDERNGKIMEGVNLFKYTVCMYGIITMKSPCLINVCYFKNKIKLKKKTHPKKTKKIYV
jgi:hypothetical protein